MKVAVIGGGAAGFFSALAVKENHPQAQVIIFEKSNKLLAKVKVSGGGRCNVTNATTSIKELSEAYPRGGKKLKKALSVFSTQDTVQWFQSRGVKLYAQDDMRMFPVSDDSQTIIDCFLREAQKTGVIIRTGQTIKGLKQNGEKWSLQTDDESHAFDKVIIATGGSPKREGLKWLEDLGHKIEEPVPSLFTFNMPNNPITKLMGVVADLAAVSIQGTKLKSEGPLLITHWGMSGPVVLKLSAFGARTLNEMNYDFKIQVNWINVQNQEEVAQTLRETSEDNTQKQLVNVKPFALPERLWVYLLEKCGLVPTKKWGEVGKKGINKLTNILTHDEYAVKGKTTFKEEFVTCGGVSLDSIDFKTMQSTVCPGLYFCGEVMDIDGVTGGYNFQAAWTTGFIAGKLL